MNPALLVLSMGAGVLFADAGFELSAFLLGAWLLFAASLVGVSLLRVRRKSQASSDAGRSDRGLIVAGMLAAAGLSFLCGFERLDAEHSRAIRDSALAESALGEGLRVAEARVVSRRTGRWGDEVELAGVFAVDGRGRLPSRLMLRVDPREDPTGGDPSSRAAELLWPGAWVRLGLHVAPYRSGRNPGNPDRAHRLARRGYSARARLMKPGWVLSLSKGTSGELNAANELRHARRVWRTRVAERLGAHGRGGALVAALGLGDRSGISRETRDGFRRLGLSHLLAVSGLHVGFVAALAGWLVLRFAGWTLTRWLDLRIFDGCLALACVAAALYAWTTGAGVSVERAALLFGLFTLCRLSMRSLTPTAALSWVALGVLWIAPSTLFDVGAQLSFGACATLILGGFWNDDVSADSRVPLDLGFVEKIRRVGGETLRASLAISLGTAPLLIQAGLPLALVAPVVNVIAIPWLGVLVLPASLFAVLLSGLLPDVVFSGLMWPAELLASAVTSLAAWLPEASERAMLALPILILLCAAGLWCIRRGRWRRVSMLWLGIALAGGAPFAYVGSMDGLPRAVFFDMGQGDATLLQGREAVLVIDTGPGPPDDSGGRVLVQGLSAMGVHAIDVLVVTHGDLDHRGGAVRLLASLPVAELWLPSAGRRDEPLVVLARAAHERGTAVRWLSAGAKEMDRGDLSIDVLWPPVETAMAPRSRNDGSLVLRVMLDEMTFLFAADISAAVEADLSKRPEAIVADVLKVGHHGSRSSSTPGFLEGVGASIAVVSAPCDPTRGLPSGRALARLRQAGATLWWTGRDGAVVLSRGEDDQIVATGWGARRRCERSWVNRD